LFHTYPTEKQTQVYLLRVALAMMPPQSPPSQELPADVEGAMRIISEPAGAQVPKMASPAPNGDCS
jgi:hypothetical protein